jgi:hypothetical protein
MRARLCIVAAAAGIVLTSAGAHAISPPGTSCSVFPSNNVWRANISKLPVHARSAAWLASMGSGRRLHPDFGPSGLEMPYGIPYDVVAGSHSKVSLDFDYADESDPGPYPFGSDTTIEMGSDRHALMLDKDNCRLYELYAAQYSPSGSTAGSGAIFDLRSNDLRPAGWTSADAAGLPIFAGLLRLDEVKTGVVDHAVRMTASRTDRAYLWPARHQAGAASDHSLPPMGARFRLKAGFATGGYRSDTQVVLRAFKTYGLILADNGSDWYFQGTAEDGWPAGLLDELKSIPASAFEAIDESGIMAQADSGRVRTKIRFTSIVYNPSGDDVSGETVTLRNVGTNPTWLKGWTVRDASGHVYTIGGVTLKVGASLVLHTRSGTNSGGHLYWGSSSAIWNNSGDTASLRSSSGTLMDSCRYSGGAVSVTC